VADCDISRPALAMASRINSVAMISIDRLAEDALCVARGHIVRMPGGNGSLRRGRVVGRFRFQSS